MTKKEVKKRKTLNLKDVITQEEYEKLFLIAKKNHRSVTGHVGWLITQELEKPEKE